MVPSRPGFAKRVLFCIVLGIILLYLVFPFYWALRSALMSNDDLIATPLQWFPAQAFSSLKWLPYLGPGRPAAPALAAPRSAKFRSFYYA